MEEFEKLQVDNFRMDLIESRLNRLKKILLKINMTSGKAKSKGKIKVLYRRYFQLAQRVLDSIKTKFGWILQKEVLPTNDASCILQFFSLTNSFICFFSCQQIMFPELF